MYGEVGYCVSGTGRSGQHRVCLGRICGILCGYWSDVLESFVEVETKVNDKLDTVSYLCYVA